MAEGTDTYKGLAAPLFGDFELKQRTAATDIVTITAATGASGDFLVCQTVGGGEVFVVGAAGELTVGSTLSVTSTVTLSGDLDVTGFINPANATTAPTTALTKGDIFIGFGHTRPQIGICISTAANTLWYLTADTSVWGSTTRNSA